MASIHASLQRASAIFKICLELIQPIRIIDCCVETLKRPLGPALTYQKLFELWWESISSVGDMEVSYNQHQLQTKTRQINVTLLYLSWFNLPPYSTLFCKAFLFNYPYEVTCFTHDVTSLGKFQKCQTSKGILAAKSGSSLVVQSWRSGHQFCSLVLKVELALSSAGTHGMAITELGTYEYGIITTTTSSQLYAS